MADSFFTELKRRNVFKVGIAYLVLAWVVLQIADVIIPALSLPEWTLTLLVVIGIFGFPFAIFFAWAFEITPEGIKKESDIIPEDSIAAHTGRKLDFIIITLLIVGLGYFIWESRFQESPVIEDPQVTASEVTINKTVAVLPFTSFSEDKEQGWFADGLTEEILNALARTRDILVSSRTSSFSFRGSNKKISTIAKELGVAHVLEGSVRRGGDMIRVTAQLIRASDGFHLWSETYDRDFKDIIEIQEDVAISIANALQTAMNPKALTDMLDTGTSSVDAYEAFLEAKVMLSAPDFESSAFDKINALLKRAIELDPEFSRAYGLLGMQWLSTLELSIMGDDTKTLSTSERYTLGTQYLDKAIAIQSNHIDKAFYRGIKALYNLKFKDAESIFETILDENPTHREAHIKLINLKIMMGDRDGVRPLIARSKDLFTHDSRYYINQVINNVWSLNIKEAVSMADEGVAKFPRLAGLAYQAQRAYLMNSDIEKAAKVLKVVLTNLDEVSSKRLAELRQACATDDITKANLLFQKMLNNVETDKVDFWLPSQTLGKTVQARTYLQHLDNEDRLIELSSYLYYYHFDVGDYPNLRAALELQGIKRPPIQPVIFACKN